VLDPAHDYSGLNRRTYLQRACHPVAATLSKLRRFAGRTLGMLVLSRSAMNGNCLHCMLWCRMTMGHSAPQTTEMSLPPVERCILSIVICGVSEPATEVLISVLTLADKSLRRLSAGEKFHDDYLTFQYLKSF